MAVMVAPTVGTCCCISLDGNVTTVLTSHTPNGPCIYQRKCKDRLDFIFIPQRSLYLLGGNARTVLNSYVYRNGPHVSVE